MKKEVERQREGGLLTTGKKVSSMRESYDLQTAVENCQQKSAWTHLPVCPFCDVCQGGDS